MDSCSNDVVMHISREKLKKLVRKEKDEHVLKRLLFINQLYLDASIPEACERLCISHQTGYDWLSLWNEYGPKGLRPHFSGGKASRLSDADKEQIREKLRTKTCWLIHEVRAFIIKDFGITYSQRHVIRILRSFGMNYSKPYVNDYRKPEEAQELLRETIKEAVKDLPEDTVIGFLDEASPQTTDNRQRFWSFGRARKEKNTTKFRANTFGFYPVNGKEVIEFEKNSKIPAFRDFLRKIGDKNPGKHILVFADNFATHKSAEIKRFAESIGITITFIPKYSPDLNPIEFIWKSIRRMVSRIAFVRSEWALKESIRTAFHRFARRRSFMEGWMEKFGDCFSSLLCQ